MKKDTVNTNVDETREEKIKKALSKKAIGYDATETVEEYALGDDGVKLTKKKITKKNVPPDITAIKILLDDDVKSVTDMTDEELEKEKVRLIKMLAEEKE